MSIRYLIDTNILVYVHDHADAARRARSVEVLRRVGAEPSAAVPAQVLAEFASVALRKMKPPMTPAAVYAQLEELERAFPVLPLTAGVVLEATRGVRDHRLSYYDAQIWAVAKLGQIPVVLSEDFSDGARIEGVSFHDPFGGAFDVERL